MSKQIVPKVSIVEGIPVATSLDIADFFSKRHKDVLKSIREADCSRDFRRLNFAPAKYIDAQGKPRPMSNITKDGFVFVMMGFTGKKAAQLKEAYIRKFNQMDEQLQMQGLLVDFDTKGKLPNDLRATGEMYAVVTNRITLGQTYLRKLRRFRKRCAQHIVDLSTKPLPEPPEDSIAMAS